MTLSDYLCSQVEGAQDVSAMSVPTLEQREELYDPLAMPDVDK